MILISYTTSSYYQNMEDMLHECCERFGIVHKRYDQEWFHSTPYYYGHRDVADCLRMAGFGIWKPIIIEDAFRYDDLVCYVDASVVFSEDPRPAVESVKEMAVGDCGTQWVNREWIRRDTFHYMNCDSEEYWNSFMVWAGVIVVRKTAVALLDEFRIWCESRRIISDDDNVCGLPNFPGFVQNRSEQAILALMQVKYPDRLTKLISPFHDYSGNWSEWVSWKAKGRR